MPNNLLETLIQRAQQQAPKSVGRGPIPPTLPRDPAGDPSWFRADGSEKGQGFLGTLPTKNGVMSELSIADSEQIKDPNGQYQDYPTLVPALNPSELQSLLAYREGMQIPNSVKQKAEAFALERLKAGKPLFARTGEQPHLSPELSQFIRSIK